MPTILQIMEGMGSVLRTIPKLHVDVLATTGQINPPHAIVGVPAIPDYRRAYSGPRLNLEPTVTILTSAAFDQVGSARLATFTDPSGETSVYAAFARDHTLGGIVESCRVKDFRPLDAEEFGALSYFGGIFTLEVMARG